MVIKYFNKAFYRFFQLEVEGNKIEILPEKLIAQVRGIQTHGGNVQEVNSGDRAALNLTKIDINVLNRGTTISSLGLISITNKLLANLQNEEIIITNKIKDLEFKNSLLTNNLDLDYIEILLRKKFLLGKKNEKFFIIEKNDN